MITWLRHRSGRPGQPPSEGEAALRRDLADTHEVIGSVRTLVARLNLLAGRLEAYVDEQEGTVDGHV